MWNLILTAIVCLILFLVMKKIYSILEHSKKLEKFPQMTIPLGRLLKEAWRSQFDPEVSLNKYTGKKFVTETVENFRSKGPVIVWTGWSPLLMLVRHEDVQVITKSIHVKSPWYEMSRPFFRDGLVSKAGSRWKKFRKLTEPSFNTNSLSGYVPIMQKHGEILVRKIRQLVGDDIDAWHQLDDLFEKTTFNIICETAMGVSTEIESMAGRVENLLDFVNQGPLYLTQRTMNPLLWNPSVFTFYLRITQGNKVEAIETFVRDLIENAIKRKTSQTEADVGLDNEYQGASKKREIFLNQLVNIYMDGINGNSTGITIDDIHDEVNNFLLAGFDTLFNTMIWVLYLLGLHQDVQDKVYEEILSELGATNDSNIEWNSLNNMVQLEASIKEALRLFPPTPFLQRKAEKDFNLGQYTVPKGTEILFSLWSVHHDPEVFPDPEKYDPGRFSKERIGEIPSGAFIPFGSGPRTCIGNRFALVELKVLTALIVKNFKIVSFRPLQDIQWQVRITIDAVPAIKFQMIPRS